MGVIVKGENGMPILFANVPNAGSSKIATTQKSGNNAHDTSSGKFAVKGGVPKKTNTPPNTDPHEYARMFAAVREAARKLNPLDEKSALAFLGTRASKPDQVDIANFLSMVKQQRINDLSDIFNSQLETKKGLDTGASSVTITASPRWVSASVAGLQPNEVEQLVNVLVSLGNEEKDVRALFKNSGGKVTLSDAISFELPPPPLTRLELADAIAEAIAKMPTPQITVNIPEPKPKTVKIVRDELGLLQTVEGL